MILVTVGQKYSLYPAYIFLDIGKIGYYDIDSEHIRVRKRKPAVDDYHVVPALVAGHVFAYFVKSAERDYSDRRLRRPGVSARTALPLFSRSFPPAVPF